MVSRLGGKKIREGLRFLRVPLLHFGGEILLGLCFDVLSVPVPATLFSISRAPQTPATCLVCEPNLNTHAMQLSQQSLCLTLSVPWTT